MTPTNVELYEALKPTVGEAAAKMIAEVVPPTRDLATKADVDALRADMRVGFAEIAGRFHEVDAQIHAEGTRTIKWLLGFFVPVWLGTWGTVVAVLLKS